MLIDTHCHVHFNAYKDDMDDVVRVSLSAGVQMVTIGTQKDASANGILAPLLPQAIRTAQSVIK